MMLENAITRSPVATQTDPATHAECLEFVRAAIASNDRQTALDIKNVLAEVCENGHADRKKIWADLTDTEKSQFQELLAPSPIAPLIEKIHAAQTWAEAESVWGGDLDLKAQIKVALSREELVRIGKLYKQAHLQPKPNPSPAPIAPPQPQKTQTAIAPEDAVGITDTIGRNQRQKTQTAIAPEDAAKMRDIALVWWPEMYPEILQSLVTQMFGWNAPGTKYDAATVTAWLAGEDELVRDRISELWLLKHGEGLDSLDCGF
ncbi:hypothetical protein [Microcoleus sp. AT9b-C5]|uniref:hypothetical protein n=1 Tax=unclassified Microcoleus TaxID=2642155 RepID=UPI002FD0774D